MKENCEKISQDYMKKYEELEQKFELIAQHNNDLSEKNKKLELMARYDSRFGSTNNGIRLDGLMMTEQNLNDEKTNKESDASEKYAGFMKVNLNPTKRGVSLKKPVSMNLNAMSKDFMIRDINMISLDILHKKEQYSKVFFNLKVMILTKFQAC